MWSIRIKPACGKNEARSLGVRESRLCRGSASAQSLRVSFVASGFFESVELRTLSSFFMQCSKCFTSNPLQLFIPHPVSQLPELVCESRLSSSRSLCSGLLFLRVWFSLPESIFSTLQTCVILSASGLKHQPNPCTVHRTSINGE